MKDNGSPETSVTPNSFNNRRGPESMIHLIIKKFEMRLNDASGEINAFHSLSFPCCLHIFDARGLDRYERVSRVWIDF